MHDEKRTMENSLVFLFDGRDEQLPKLFDQVTHSTVFLNGIALFLTKTVDVTEQKLPKKKKEHKYTGSI